MVSEHASPLAALGGADAGGQNVHVGALGAALVRQGHDVVVHTRRDDAEGPVRVTTADRLVVDRVDAGPARPVPKDELRPYMDDFAAALAERWKDDRPDVVHAHFWMSGLASMLAAPPLGVPVVMTFHALGSVKRRHQREADTSPHDRVEVERWLAGEVDEVIATCHDEVTELEWLGSAPRHVSVIPCGVDLTLFRPHGRAVPRGRGWRVAVVGRLVERKGVADAIESLRWLRDTELVVAGGPSPEHLASDPDVRRLQSVAERFNLTKRVRFLGCLSRPEVPLLLRSADAAVCVPHYEPFGMVPLEAMACGTPPVASAVGGLKESVVDEGTGLLVPPGDPRALADALSRLFEDMALARRLRAAGIRRARRVYGWHSIGARTAAVYKEVVARTAAPSLSGDLGR